MVCLWNFSEYIVRALCLYLYCIFSFFKKKVLFYLGKLKLLLSL